LHFLPELAYPPAIARRKFPIPDEGKSWANLKAEFSAFTRTYILVESMAHLKRFNLA
jgi:hypothetical protein